MMKRTLSTFIALLILALGIGGCKWMILTKPQAAKRPREKQIPIVDVIPLEPGNITVELEAMGTVQPAVEANVQPEVSGTVVWTHPDFYPGAVVPSGTPLIKIDVRDYEYTLNAKKAAYQSALADLQIEMGQQDIAREEWTLLGETQQQEMDQMLALRQPQLAQKKAAADAARAELTRAELNVERATIRAPFDASILSTHADIGDRAAAGSVVAVLAGSETYWVRATLKTGDLQWLYNPEDHDVECEASVFMADQKKWPACFVSVLPDVQADGRMAQILLAVKDPRGSKNGNEAVPLLIGSYVHVRLQGRTIDNVIEISRDALRDGRQIWVLTDQNKLQIAPVEILWETEDSVFVQDDFPDEARLIVSGIGTPVDGMSLMSEEEAKQQRNREGNMAADLPEGDRS